MRRLSVVAFVLMVSIVASGVLQADETPTPEPPIIDPATATLEPTWTPLPTLTPEPSFTWTSIPTSTDTPMATSIQTETPTTTLEAVATETPTATGSLEASPSETSSPTMEFTTVTTTTSPTATLEIPVTFTPGPPPFNPNDPKPEFGVMQSQNEFGMMQQLSIPECLTLPPNATIVSTSEGFALAIECINNDQVTIEAPRTAYDIYIASGTVNIDITDITISRSVNIYGRGNDISSFQMSPTAGFGFYIYDTGFEQTIVRFSHITFKGPTVPGTQLGFPAFGGGYGGMFHNAGANIYIQDSVVKDSVSAHGGGAIYNQGPMYLERNRFENNRSGGGGAIQNQNDLFIQCNTFVNNHANYGVAILNVGGIPVFNNNSFLNNNPHHFYQFNNAFVNAGSNYWNGSAMIAGFTGSVSTSPLLPSDPSGVGPCTPSGATPLPPTGCAAGNMSLVSDSPAPQFRLEQTDMKAIGSAEEGLYKHDGPTWNSKKYGAIPWGSIVGVDGRFQLSNGEIWFRLRQRNTDGQALENDVWINAQSGAYSYLIDHQSCLNPAIINFNDPDHANEPITFVYDRDAVAKYAMAHAYRNSESDPSYIEKEGILDVEVTDRIEDQTIAEGTIPYASTIPYFDFKFYLVYAGGTTGSAYFTSQSIWFGGIPMTKDKDAIEERCSGYPLIVTEQGWRHCRDKGSNGVFSNHDGIMAFLSDTDTNAAANVSTYRFNIEIIHPRGVYADLITITKPTGKLTQNILDNLGDIQGGVEKDIQGEKLYNDMQISVIDEIKSGDYVWTSRSDPARHGYLVVGWGPIVKCSVALSTLWSLDADPTTSNLLYETLTSANSHYQWSVPYVSDFSRPFDFAEKQRPRPRPFYCSQYADNGAYQDSFDGFRFNTLPDYVELPANMIYISEKME